MVRFLNRFFKKRNYLKTTTLETHFQANIHGNREKVHSRRNFNQIFIQMNVKWKSPTLNKSFHGYFFMATLISPCLTWFCVFSYIAAVFPNLSHMLTCFCIPTVPVQLLLEYRGMGYPNWSFPCNFYTSVPTCSQPPPSSGPLGWVFFFLNPHIIWSTGNDKNKCSQALWIPGYFLNTLFFAENTSAMEMAREVVFPFLK